MFSWVYHRYAVFYICWSPCSVFCSNTAEVSGLPKQNKTKQKSYKKTQNTKAIITAEGNTAEISYNHVTENIFLNIKL